MPEPEIVRYLKDNLKRFPIEQLRAQLAKEGVGDADFDEALRMALVATERKPVKSGGAAKLFLGAGVALAVVGALLALREPAVEPLSSAKPPSAEGGFVGHHGYVVRLPPDYIAVQSFRDERRKAEIVHFCPKGTDPSNFLNEGLYGQLGIVKLEIQTSPLAGTLNGLDTLARIVGGRAKQNNEKYTLKNLQGSSMRGIQVSFDGPFPRVESYILGERHLYSFSAGQDDEIYRGILESLRDPRSEL